MNKDVYEIHTEYDGTHNEPKMLRAKIHADLPEYMRCNKCRELFTGVMAWSKHRTMDRYSDSVTCLPVHAFGARGLSQNKYGAWRPFKGKNEAEVEEIREQIKKMQDSLTRIEGNWHER